ncbi:hypothetical protein COT94_04395 [Candidatus Falkowbacteria bacterium CG10_big_fil_rev_8_21_14_0_10_37_14]|uniref:Uncharacterized protein n=1 Tax=Candidatus Falkowbacteria bacterium CG10_big_fil_rev_8_21_14_0_10_37_14 TaxID=1974561 RepID=A0A2M6WSW1_9BACT|nr:MAG: hypothetical protein COT94_04395 [Candidatus Falkowbacteria bacterium CG10_big_fil_rev_8_21_14_0_10_37_14]
MNLWWSYWLVGFLCSGLLCVLIIRLTLKKPFWDIFWKSLFSISVLIILLLWCYFLQWIVRLLIDLI